MACEAEDFIRLIVLMRSKGVSIRSIAKCFGESKSTIGRWVQIIEASQLGQDIKLSLDKPSVP